MKFTVHTQPLIRMLELVGERRPGRKRGTEKVRLVACQGRVCVERGNTVAESEAVTWEDGRCTVSLPRLLAVLKHCVSEGSLTLETRGQDLFVGRRSLPMLCYCSSAVAPGGFQIFLATDLGVVPSHAAMVDLAQTA